MFPGLPLIPCFRMSRLAEIDLCIVPHRLMFPGCYLGRSRCGINSYFDLTMYFSILSSISFIKIGFPCASPTPHALNMVHRKAILTHTLHAITSVFLYVRAERFSFSKIFPPSFWWWLSRLGTGQELLQSNAIRTSKARDRIPAKGR